MAHLWHVASGVILSSTYDIYIYIYVHVNTYVNIHISALLCVQSYSNQLTVAVESLTRRTHIHLHQLGERVKHSTAVCKELKSLHIAVIAIKSFSKCVAIIKHLLVHISIPAVAHALRSTRTTCRTFHSLFKVSSCSAVPSILCISEFPAFFRC